MVIRERLLQDAQITRDKVLLKHCFLTILTSTDCWLEEQLSARLIVMVTSISLTVVFWHQYP